MSKFNLVVVALDSDTVNGVLDLLKNPPVEGPVRPAEGEAGAVFPAIDRGQGEAGAGIATFG